MPEARDRLVRSNERVIETYTRRRTSRGATTTIGVFSDNGDNGGSGTSVDGTPFRWRDTPLTGGGGSAQESGFSGGRVMRGSGSGRGLFETPMTVYRRGGRSWSTGLVGGGYRRGRGGRGAPRSVLPLWYRRTPLSDNTDVIRAIERRRVHFGTPTPIRIGEQLADQDPSPSNAQLEHEHDVSFVTPKPNLASKAYTKSGLGSIPMMLTTFVDKCEGESDFKTPQRRLLDSIEIVQKIVMEELDRLKRTPSAKKAERERKVKILMSMR